MDVGTLFGPVVVRPHVLPRIAAVGGGVVQVLIHVAGDVDGVVVPDRAHFCGDIGGHADPDQVVGTADAGADGVQHATVDADALLYDVGCAVGARENLTNLGRDDLRCRVVDLQRRPHRLRVAAVANVDSHHAVAVERGNHAAVLPDDPAGAHEICLVHFGGEPPLVVLDEIGGIGQVGVQHGAVQIHGVVAELHVLSLGHLPAVSLRPLRPENGVDLGFEVLLEPHGPPQGGNYLVLSRLISLRMLW